MTSWKIQSEGTGLRIEIRNLRGEVAPLLAALGDCQRGQCSCPTNEYKKLEVMDVSERDGVVSIELTPRQGMTIDQAEVERCLTHTTKAPS